MMRERSVVHVVGVLTAGFLLLAANPISAVAADNGTLSLTVTGAAPCIVVSNGFDFGTLPFSQPNADSASATSYGPGPSARNCGAQSEVFLAHGSSATNGNVSWALIAPTGLCSAGLNKYYFFLKDYPFTTSLGLTTTDQTFLSGVAGGSTATLTGGIGMPCTGSDGAGLQMSSTITLTATF